MVRMLIPVVPLALFTVCLVLVLLQLDAAVHLVGNVMESQFDGTFNSAVRIQS